MSDYRRWYVPGGTYFFTLVTHERRFLFDNRVGLNCLRSAWRLVRQRWPFETVAIVVLPDHLHAIWSLPKGDSDFSKRWGLIKTGFTRRCSIPHISAPCRDAGIWQPRFWEHLIRDEQDFSAHMDYLHYNPVKHRLAARVVDWRWSSFHRCVRRGMYSPNWGQSEPSAPSTGFGE